MKKKPFFIIFTIFFSIIYSNCTLAQKIEKDNNYLVYDYENFNHSHAKWMFKNAEYYFSDQNSAKLIVKEKTELKFSGIYLFFVNYELNGFIISDVSHEKEKSLLLTIIFYAFFIILFLRLMCFRFKNINDSFVKASIDVFILGAKYYFVFLLIFFMILGDIGASYGFSVTHPLLVPLLFLLMLTLVIRFKTDKVISKEKEAVNILMIFIAFTMSLYLFSEVFFTFQFTLIFFFVLVLSLFLTCVYNFIKET